MGCSAVFGNYGIEEEIAGVKAVAEGVIGFLNEAKD